MQLGTVISLPLSGYLCELEWDNGWPLAFYVPGIATVIWFVFWVLFVYEEPDVHPRIAEDEKQYILASTSKSQHKVEDLLTTTEQALITGKLLAISIFSRIFQFHGYLFSHQSAFGPS